MSHKKIAQEFIEMAGLGDVRKAYELYVAPHFKHHNQYFKGDRTSLMEAMAEASISSPNKTLKVKQILEEGDKVMTHSLVIKNEIEIAVVHIFRFEQDKIVELWDLGQVIDKNSPNENGLF